MAGDDGWKLEATGWLEATTWTGEEIAVNLEFWTLEVESFRVREWRMEMEEAEGISIRVRILNIYIYLYNII